MTARALCILIAFALSNVIADPYDSITSAINRQDYTSAIPLLISKKNELSKNIENNVIALATVEGILGTIYLNQNKLDSSVKHFSESYYFYRKENTEKARKPLGITASNLSLVYSLQKKYSNASSILKDAIGLLELTKVKDQRILAGLVLSLASSQMHLKQFVESKSSYHKALGIAVEAYTLHHPIIAGIHNNIGELHFSQENYKAALDAYKQAFDIYSMPMNADSTYLFNICINIGKTETRLHNYENGLISLLAAKKYLSPEKSDNLSGQKELFEFLTEAFSNINCDELAKKYRAISDSLKKLDSCGISGSIYKINL